MGDSGGCEDGQRLTAHRDVTERGNTSASGACQSIEY
jgi:hypothetical protein